MAVLGKIIRKIDIKTVIKNGTSIKVTAAVQTQDWVRTEEMAKKVGEEFANSFEKFDGDLPAGTDQVCTRESEHPSPSDSRQHFTAVAFSDNEKAATTLHVPVKKE